MSEITVNTEKVIKALENVEKAVTDLRAVLAPGVFKKVEPICQPPKEKAEIIALYLDVSMIPFKVKGGSPARDSDGFAFTFLRGRDGEIWQSSAELANALHQYGKVRVGRFVYQLSKDEVFIQRVIAKDVSQ